MLSRYDEIIIFVFIPKKKIIQILIKDTKCRTIYSYIFNASEINGTLRDYFVRSTFLSVELNSEDTKVASQKSKPFS